MKVGVRFCSSHFNKSLVICKTKPMLCTYTLLTSEHYVTTKCLLILSRCFGDVKHITMIMCERRNLKHLLLAAGWKHSLGMWDEVKVLMEEALKYMEALLPDEMTLSLHWSPTACCGSQVSAHPHLWTVHSQVYDVMLKWDAFLLFYSSTTDCLKSFRCIFSTSQKFGHTVSFSGFSLFLSYLHCRYILKTSTFRNNACGFLW